MNKLDLITYGVHELNVEEKRNENGGSFAVGLLVTVVIAAAVVLAQIAGEYVGEKIYDLTH